MTFKIIGVEFRAFKTKDDKTVNGVLLHCVYEKKGVDGYCFDKDSHFWVSEAVYKNAMVGVGDLVELVFNRWGKIDRVVAV